MKRLYPLLLACLLLGGAVYFFTEQGRVAVLRQETDRLRLELETARRALSDLEGKRNEQQQELERLRSETREVHQLRGEVSQLRAGAKNVEQLRTENQQLRTANQQLKTGPATAASPPTTTAAAAPQAGLHPRESWAFSGFATPEAALQSALWAMREGDLRAFRSALTPEEMARVQGEWGDKSEAEISANTKRSAEKISSIRILESQALSDDEVVLSIYAAGGEDRVQKVSMRRFGGEWKLAGPKKD